MMFSNAFDIFLIATFSFVFRSFAEQTTPYAPFPAKIAQFLKWLSFHFVPYRQPSV